MFKCVRDVTVGSPAVHLGAFPDLKVRAVLVLVPLQRHSALPAPRSTQRLLLGGPCTRGTHGWPHSEPWPETEVAERSGGVGQGMCSPDPSPGDPL